MRSPARVLLPTVGGEWKQGEDMNPNYYQDTPNPVACDECGHPCHADDAVTDGVVALCGSLRGNGCADRVRVEGVTA